MQAANEALNETSSVFYPILKNKWKNVVAILKEKAPPEQKHESTKANTGNVSTEGQAEQTNTSHANTSNIATIHGHGSSKDDDISPAAVIGAAAIYASVAQEKQQNNSGGRGVSNSGNDHNDTHHHNSIGSGGFGHDDFE